MCLACAARILVSRAFRLRVIPALLASLQAMSRASPAMNVSPGSVISGRRSGAIVTRPLPSVWLTASQSCAAATLACTGPERKSHASWPASFAPLAVVAAREPLAGEIAGTVVGDLDHTVVGFVHEALVADRLVLVADRDDVHRCSQGAEGDDRDQPQRVAAHLVGVTVVPPRVDCDALDHLGEQPGGLVGELERVELRARRARARVAARSSLLRPPYGSSGAVGQSRPPTWGPRSRATRGTPRACARPLSTASNHPLGHSKGGRRTHEVRLAPPCISSLKIVRVCTRVGGGLAVR